MVPKKKKINTLYFLPENVKHSGTDKKLSGTKYTHYYTLYSIHIHTNVKYYTYYMVKIIGYIKKRSKAENEEYIFYGDGNNMYGIG